MAIDCNGYIALPNHNSFQPTYSRVLEHVVKSLTFCFPTLIHSLYVYGSGNAAKLLI